MAKRLALKATAAKRQKTQEVTKKEDLVVERDLRARLLILKTRLEIAFHLARLPLMKTPYPSRLFHKTPSWVEDGSVFHIRIRCDSGNTVVLSQSPEAENLLASADFCTGKGRWFAHLFLLMPDHVHALLSFPREDVMSRVIADWKRYQSKELGIRWQDNFFDHRIRSTAEYLEKAAYIRRNPVVKGLCETPEEWPWAR